MPGVNLWIGAPETEEPRLLRFQQAQAMMQHAPDYRASLDFRKGGVIAGHVAYPDYPVEAFSEDGISIIIEGEIYAPTGLALRPSLVELFRRAFSEPDASLDLTRQWITEYDGDYNVIGTSPDGRRVNVFSDLSGRLPLYCYRSTSELIVSREPKFIALVRRAWDYDRIGWGQYIWFGFSLGRRTLWSEIERLPGGFLLETRRLGDGIATSLRELVVPNLDEKDLNRSVEDWAAELADQFTEGARLRARRPGKNVVSLSGGHDSRSVTAALRRAGVPCIAATFRTGDRTSVADAVQAQRIAASLGVPWHRFDLSPPDSASRDRIVWLKDGLNFVPMAFILTFLERLVTEFGRSAVYWTGDGGRVFTDLRPRRTPTTLAEALRDVVALESVAMSELVEASLDLSRGSLIESLERVLRSYPEEQPIQKVIHFRVYERWRSWMFEGEDRNRFFLWEATPFYTLSFLRSIMRVPDNLKTHGILYRAFQQRLSPAIVRIPHADVGQPVGSLRYRWRLSLAARMPRWLKDVLRGRVGKRREPSRNVDSAIAELRDALRPGRRLGTVLSESTSRPLVSQAAIGGIDSWRTLVALDRIWSERIGDRHPVADEEKR